MDSIGNRLREARLKKKITLEKASRDTKIHIDVLRSLEEESFSLEPIYIKGHLKIYSQYLGLDSQSILRDYLSLIPAPRETKLPEIVLFKAKKRLGLGLALSLGVLSLIIYIFFIQSKRLTFEKSEVEPGQAPSKKQEIEVPSKPTQASSIKLAIKASENCWLKIKLDGKLSFQGILPEGAAETWQADKRIVLSVGNAGGIDLEVNGKILSPLGRRGEVIRQIIITKEGVQIGR